MTLVLEFCVAAYAAAFLTELLAYLRAKRTVLLRIYLTEDRGSGRRVDDDVLNFRFPTTHGFIWMGLTLGLAVGLLLLDKYAASASLVSRILVFPLIIFWVVWLFGSGWHLPFSAAHIACAENDWQQLKQQLGEFDRRELFRPEVQKVVRVVTPWAKIIVAIAAACILAGLITMCLHTAHIGFIIAAVVFAAGISAYAFLLLI